MGWIGDRTGCSGTERINGLVILGKKDKWTGYDRTIGRYDRGTERTTGRRVKQSGYSSTEDKWTCWLGREVKCGDCSGSER